MNKGYQTILHHPVRRSISPVLMGLLGCLSVGISPVQAANSTTVSIMGTVFIGPSCTINSNTSIHVPFGDNLDITQIDGSNYKKDIPLNLSCTGNPSTLRFTFGTNSGSGFEPTALSTNIADLAIRLLKPDGTPLNLNETFEVPYTVAGPSLKAVPIKRTGAVLPTGGFGASATLTLEVL